VVGPLQSGDLGVEVVVGFDVVLLRFGVPHDPTDLLDDAALEGDQQPGLLAGHDVLRAEVLARADARLELYLFQHDLDTWKDELSGLAPGTGALIGGDRGLSLVLHMLEGVPWSWRSTIPTGSARCCGSGRRRTG
jgi:hypothetical protein